MATTIAPAYPFDPTGLLASNKILGEQHPLTAQNFKDYQLVIPRWSPIFQDGLLVDFRDLQGSTRRMVFGIDYYLGYKFQDASLSTAKPIYGAIYFLDRNLAGTVSITYQTLGGDWTLDQQQILELLADRTHNPLITTWEQVTDLPVYFPPTAHQWNIYDMVGMSDVREAINGIEAAIRAAGGGAMDDHINNRNNPHNVTKAQVGLGLVNNYGTATSIQTATGTATDLYTTPAGVRAAIIAVAGDKLDAHIANTNNPHGVSAAQVGAPTVAQMQAGLDEKLGKNAPAVDSNRFDGKLYAEAKADILAGTAANATQLGGLSVAQLTAQILAGKAADSSRLDGNTLAQVLDMVQQLVVDMDILSGTAANSIRFAGRNWAEAMAEILSGTAANADKFANMTVADWEQYIVQYIEGLTELPATATNTTKFDGRTWNQAVLEILSGKAADSAKFDGLTPAEYNTAFLDSLALMPAVTLTATDSQMLSGKTYQELLADMGGQTAGNADKFDNKTASDWRTIINDSTVAGAMSFDGRNSSEYADYVFDYGIANRAQPPFSIQSETLATTTYVPIATGLVNTVNQSNSRAAVTTVQIVSRAAGVTGEKALTEIVIHQVGREVTYSIAGYTPALVDVGIADMAGTTVEVDGVTHQAVAIYLRLATGTRLAGAQSTTPYRTSIALPTSTTAAPAGYASARFTPRLGYGAVGLSRASQYVVGRSALTFTAGDATCFTDIAYYDEPTDTAHNLGAATFLVTLGASRDHAHDSTFLVSISDDTGSAAVTQVTYLTGGDPNWADYIKFWVRSTANAGLNRTVLVAQTGADPKGVSVSAIKQSSLTFPLAPVQVKVRPASTTEVVPVPLASPGVERIVKTGTLTGTATVSITDFNQDSIMDLTVQLPGNPSQGWLDGSATIDLARFSDRVELTNRSGQSLQYRLVGV